MRLKYKVGLSLLVVGIALGFGGYAANLVYVMIAGWVLGALGFSVLMFASKDDKSILSILIDAITFMF